MIVYSYQALPFSNHGLEQWLAVIVLKHLETGRQDCIEALGPRWSESQARSDAMKRLNELKRGVA